MTQLRRKKLSTTSSLQKFPKLLSKMTERKQDLPSYTKDDYLFLEKRLDIIALLSVAAEIGDETDQLSAVIEEAASGNVKIKNMANGEEAIVAVSEACETVRAMIGQERN